MWEVGGAQSGPKEGTPPKTGDKIKEQRLGKNPSKSKQNEMSDVISNTSEAICVLSGKSHGAFGSCLV